MTSLRARLFVWLAALVAAAGLASGYLAYRWSFDEAIELQDATLLQVGALAAANRFHTALPPVSGVDAEARIAIAELDVPDAHANAPLQNLPENIGEGLQTVPAHNGPQRVYVARRPDGSRVAVAQAAEARNEIARGSALRAAVPLALLVPGLMALIGLVIHFSFRPISRLTCELETKGFDCRGALPAAGAPDELRPFILAINGLLGRLQEQLDRERRFIADAAHELRTPIAALSLQAENLERASSHSERQDRSRALRGGIRRTAHLLEQLLDHAKYQNSANSAAFSSDLAEIAKTAVSDLVPLAGARSIDLGFLRCEPAPGCVDATALAIAVRNLIDNALRYSPEGGRVDVSVYREDGRAVFIVENAGEKIPEEEIEGLFDPFKRGSRASGEGSGLGLSIVSRIVRGHRGHIRIENVATEGSPRIRTTVIL